MIGISIELKEEINYLDTLISVSDSIVDYLNTIQYEKYNNLLFGSRIGSTISNLKLYPRTIAYENLKSLGVELVSNDSIRYHLTDIFQRKLPRISYWESAARESVINKTLSPYFKTIKSDQQYYKHLLVPDTFDSLSKKLFINKLALLQDDRNQLISLYNIPLDQITMLLELIGKEYFE